MFGVCISVKVKLTHLFITFQKRGVMLGMSGLKRTPGIKDEHMCSGGERKPRDCLAFLSSVCL